MIWSTRASAMNFPPDPPMSCAAWGWAKLIYVTEVQAAERRYWGTPLPDLEGDALNLTTKCWTVLSEKWKESYVRESTSAEMRPHIVKWKMQASEARGLKDTVAKLEQGTVVAELRHQIAQLKTRFNWAAVAGIVIGVGAMVLLAMSMWSNVLVPRLGRQRSDPVHSSAWLEREAELSTLRRELDEARTVMADLLDRGITQAGQLGRGEDDATLQLAQRTVAQMRGLEDKNVCPVCMDAPVSYCLVPCGHCFCEACARKVRRECHSCRQVVKSRQRLYLP